MKNNLTEMVFILDKSGSMSSLEDDTIGGFNSLIEKQKKEEGKANVTTILFDDQIKFLNDRVDLSNMKKMTSKDYYVGGCTALLDAVGLGIIRTIEIQKSLPHHLKAKHAMIVIMTDGYENSSRIYDYKHIQKLIHTQKEKYLWEFLFLGARIDAIKEASKLGIDQSRAVRFYEDSEGIEVSYQAVSQFTSHLRASKACDESWKERVENDYKRRR